MKYGTETTRKSYFAGKLMSTKVKYTTSHPVEDEAQVLSEFMKAMELMPKTDELVITIKNDPKTHTLRMFYKEWEVECDI